MADVVDGQSPGTELGFSDSAGAVGQLARHGGAAAAVAREEAELKAALFMAIQRPRSWAMVQQRVQQMCKRPGFAEDAHYSYPRGGQTVQGPSVYMARALAAVYGNIRAGFKIVSQDEENVHIRGEALDVETGAYMFSEATFGKRVQRKDKRTGRTEWVKPDERDLRELINKQGAICVRNAILQVLPVDLVEDASQMCLETARKAASGALGEDREGRIKKLIAAYSEYGVEAEAIEQYIGCPLKQIAPEQYAELQAIYKSIRDGNSKPSEYFGGPVTVVEEPGQSRASAMAAKVRKPAKAEPAAPPAAPEGIPAWEQLVIELAEGNNRSQAVVKSQLEIAAKKKWDVPLTECDEGHLQELRQAVSEGKIRL